MLFFKVSGLCGGGKTQRSLNYIVDELKLKRDNFIIAQPTMELIDQTYDRLKAIDPDMNVIILNSSTCDNVYECIGKHLKETKPKSASLVLCTHKAILDGLSNLSPYKKNWHLFVDEIPQIDEHFSININKTKKVFPSFFDITPIENHDYAVFTLKPNMKSLATTWCKSKTKDDVRSLMTPLLSIMNRDYSQSWIHYKRYLDSKRGEYSIHSIILPQVFDNWASVTIIGAHFENSVMCKIWSKCGVKWEQHPHIKSDPETHDEQTSSRLQIYYFSQKPWSKSLRDKIGTPKFKPLMEMINSLIEKQPTLLVANNDVQDYELRLRNSTRISNVCHGNNDYLDFQNIVCFSALNDKPDHTRWFKSVWDFEQKQLKLARGYETTYQCLMRTNLRLPSSEKNVRVIVPDLDQAMWLSKDVFPGADVKYIDEWSGVEHTRCGITVTKLEKDALLLDIKSKMSATLWSNPTLSFEQNIYQKIPIVSEMESWDQLKDLLYQSHQQTSTRKEDNLLISGAIFDPNASDETNKGLNNILVCSSVWFDFDGGDLEPSILSILFSDICHISFNSYNNGTNNQLRYRTFIPLKTPVTAKQYHMIWDILHERIEKYCHEHQLESGTDRSKRTANSWFYLPCQSANGNTYNVWLEHWNLDQILDPINLLDGHVLVEEQEPVFVPTVLNNVDYSNELERWKQANLKPGSGNRSFFALGVSLYKKGYDLPQVGNILREAAIFARSPDERRKQIPSILTNLRRIQRCDDKINKK